MKARLAIVCSVLALAGPAVAGGAISFQKLPAGDTVDVTFASSGCFHQVEYALTFERDKNVTVRLAGSGASGKGKTPEKITLSDRDLAGLDRLLKFYRAKSPGGCTTVDHITLTQKHDGKVVAEEKYTDSTCGTYDKKDLTRFPSLMQRLEGKKP